MTRSLLEIVSAGKPQDDDIDLVLVRKAIAEDNKKVIRQMAATVTVGSEADLMISKINDVDIREIWVKRDRDPVEMCNILKKEKRVTIWTSFAKSTLLENDTVFEALLTASIKDELILRVLLTGTKNSDLTDATRVKIWKNVFAKLDEFSANDAKFASITHEELHSAFQNSSDATYVRYLLTQPQRLTNAHEENARLWKNAYTQTWSRMWSWMVEVAAKDETTDSALAYELLTHISELPADWYTYRTGSLVHYVASLFTKLTPVQQEHLKPVFLKHINLKHINEQGTIRRTGNWRALTNVCNGRAIDYTEPETDYVAVLKAILVKIPSTTDTSVLTKMFNEANQNFMPSIENAKEVFKDIVAGIWLHPAATETFLINLLDDFRMYTRYIDGSLTGLFNVTDKHDYMRIKILLKHAYNSHRFVDLTEVFNETITPDKLMPYLWNDVSNRSTYQRYILDNWLESTNADVLKKLPQLVTVQLAIQAGYNSNWKDREIEILFPGLTTAPAATWESMLTLSATFEGTTGDLMETVNLLT